MSANIPFEVQAEIIKRVLHVKSLIRFRSVSKQWKSLIDNPEFVTHHSLNQNHQNHLLVSYHVDSENKYISIVDDDCFPHHKFSPDLPPTVKLHTSLTMVGSSHGLVCLYGQSVSLEKNLIVFWNPSIRKSVSVVLPLGTTYVGFGVCPKTGDPKIVNIICTTSMDWKFEVFALSTRAWRTVSMNPHMSLKDIKSPHNQVVIDGVIHWVASKSRTGLFDIILSFDVTSEEFQQVDLPANLSHATINIFNLNESLAVTNWDEHVYEVWMMIKYGDSKFRFDKLYSIGPDKVNRFALYQVIGFRKNGQIIRVHVCVDSCSTSLEVYDPCTQYGNDLGFDAISNMSFRVTSYTESLLLLNHSDSII